MAPARSLRSRKQQTRLAFQPLSSPSPAKQSYSDAVKDRLANVRYEGPRRKTRATVSFDDDEQSLPTPQPTSPVSTDAQAKPSSPLSSLRTSPALPARFADIETDISTDEDEIVPPSAKRRKLSIPEHAHEMGAGETAHTSEAGQHFSGSRRTQPVARTNNNVDSTPTRRSMRLSRQESSPPGPTASHLRRRLVSVGVPSPPRPVSNLGSAESSDDNDDVMVTRPVAPKRSYIRKSPRESPFVVEDDEIEYADSEDEPVSKKPRQRRAQDDFVVDNDEVEFVTSEEELGEQSDATEPHRLSQKQKVPKTPQKSAKQRSERIQEELAEDLLDLQDSDEKDSTKKSRTRGGPVTTQRDKAREHFDLLRRRRAGQRAPRIIDSDDDDGANDLISEDGVDIDKIGRDTDSVEITSDESVSVLQDQQPVAETYPLEYDDDFVVEDEPTTGRLGRPTDDIPLQFTSFASAKPRELFPHIVEWMVKNKISPAFDRHDDVFNLSFARLDDQVKAQAGSRLISSAWGSVFKNAILARPGIHVAALPGMDEELIRTCDACNKSNHPARYEFQFSGKSYFKDSLEPIDESDEEDEADDATDDKACHDEQGHILADPKTRFYLGRFCAANAEMGHKLTHWKHHLNGQVLSYLEEQGVLSAEAIVNREKLNKKRREKEAENIVDLMQETGMIGELWQGFQDDLEDARIGMEGYERKGGRGKGRIGSVRVRNNGTVGEWRDGGKFRQLPTQLASDSEGE